MCACGSVKRRVRDVALDELASAACAFVIRWLTAFLLCG